MSKTFSQVVMLLVPALVLAQLPSTPATFQMATIIDAKPLPSQESPNLDDRLYEVSMNVGQTVYVVLTPLASPSETIRSAEGRQLPVRIGEDTITWNDAMGQRYKSPILSKAPIDGIHPSRGAEPKSAHLN